MTDRKKPWKDDQEQLLGSPAELNEAVDAVLGEARKTVRILAPELDTPLLNRQPPLEALGRLARDRYTTVRVLLENSGPAVRAGHGLIRLAQRFPSTIEMRLLADEDRGRRDAWLVVDETGLVYRPDFERLADAHAHFHDVRLAPKLARDFDEWWERGEPDPNLRRLYI
jgi:hypothetical protein